MPRPLPLPRRRSAVARPVEALRLHHSPGPAVPVLRPAEASAASGWLVVAGAFLVMMVGYGAIYSFAAFAEEIAAEFGSTRSAVTVIYALSGGSCFFVSAVTGPLSDRLGARLLAAGGMLLVGLGLLTASAARSLPEVYLGYGLLIGVGAGCAYVPAVATVQRWFDVHRGLASGIAVSGIGLGTALVPPVADALSVIGGWRAAFAVCGVLAAFVGVAGALLLRQKPANGACDPPAAAARGGLLSRGFVFAYAGTLLVSVPSVLPHALLVSTARDLGLSHPDALRLLGLIGLGTILGRFAVSALADAAGRRPVFLATCAGLAFSMLAWACADAEVSLKVFALGFGVLQGGFVALLPAFVADSFGARGLGRLLGMLFTGRGVALLAGPPGLAAAAGLFEGHALPLVAVGALGVLGTLLLATARGGSRPPR